MMKVKKGMLCFALILAMFMTPSLTVITCAREAQSLPDTIAISAWAEEEVAKAMELGVGPTSNEYRYLPNSLSAPATREWFCMYSSRLIAYQQGCDEPSLTDVVLYYQAEKDGLGQPRFAFTDMPGADYLTALYYLGVAKGRGDGIFDPNANITRQEAATFLARVYKAYGGGISEDTAAPVLTDEDQVADWAKDSVAAMSAAGIMKGYEDGRFAPNDPYTHEQCLVTLLRLYENMPISRKNENVKPLFTYEEYMGYVTGLDERAREQNAGTFEMSRVEGCIATFVHQANGGGMGSTSRYKFIYKDGAIRSIDDFGVCDTGWGTLSHNVELVNPHFSEDGTMFYCTITLAENIENPSDAALSHEAGTYLVAIDVQSCLPSVMKQ